MAHTKIGNKKRKCEKYKLSGRRNENKLLKQERDRKRREKFKRRREEGKSYQYDKDKFPKTEPSDGGKTEYQKWVSDMAKLQNEIDSKEKEKKAQLYKLNKNNSSDPSDF